MKFHVNDTVELVKDVPDEGLKKGVIGVVVAELDCPMEAYEIEVCDENGVVVAQVAVSPDDIVRV